MTRYSDTLNDSLAGAAPQGADIIPFPRQITPDEPPAQADTEHPDDDGPSAA